MLGSAYGEGELRIAGAHAWTRAQQHLRFAITPGFRALCPRAEGTTNICSFCAEGKRSHASHYERKAILDNLQHLSGSETRTFAG